MEQSRIDRIEEKLTEFNEAVTELGNRHSMVISDYLIIKPDYTKHEYVVRLCFRGEPLLDDRLKGECEIIFDRLFPYPDGLPVLSHTSCEDQGQA